MSWYENYINNVAQDNESFYREQAQEWINDYFTDTTLVRTIQEEKYPFNGEYEDYTVHVDSVAEITTNVNKIIGDFISVIFKDCEHINYRGQKYIYDKETYLCYDKINDLAKVAKSNLIRCNNEISWLDENGNILTEKVFVGYELSSTNDNITKKALVSNRRRVIYVQCNEKTNKIKINQRFMFQHNQCFRVEEIDNYYRETNTDNDVTLMKMFIVYSPLIPLDNQELNICDYYTKDYSLAINQTDISQITGFTGKLTATVKYNDELVDVPIKWKTSDESVITIDEDTGEYTVVGTLNGEISTITCYMKDNEEIEDSIQIKVVSDYLPEKIIVVENSNITSLKEKETIEFNCYVMIEGEIQDDIVTCEASGVDTKHYVLEETLFGYMLKNLKASDIPLTLTFSADGCDDVILDIELNGLI